MNIHLPSLYPAVRSHSPYMHTQTTNYTSNACPHAFVQECAHDKWLQKMHYRAVPSIRLIRFNANTKCKKHGKWPNRNHGTFPSAIYTFASCTLAVYIRNPWDSVSVAPNLTEGLHNVVHMSKQWDASANNTDVRKIYDSNCSSSATGTALLPLFCYSWNSQIPLSFSE